jgi:hypothetical protein
MAETNGENSSDRLDRIERLIAMMVKRQPRIDKERARLAAVMERLKRSLERLE